jgi:hypothetical protein
MPKSKRPMMELRQTGPEKPWPRHEQPKVAEQKATTVDMVNAPPHYNFGKFEVFPVLQDWFNTQPLLWQVVKYLSRAKHKGNYLQDLEKAQWYLSKAIEEAKEVSDAASKVP